MEDTLKRLLAAEQEANQITERANLASERLVEQAMREAQTLEERFMARLPELRSSFIDKAEQRAEQSLKEIQRRYEERLELLRADAETNESAALDAAFACLLQPESDATRGHG
jgi:V/A-type H+/Na+-transporting ATPase subunit G/H